MYLKLAGMVESQLREAFGHRHEESGLTQSDIARLLEVDRSTIHNRLSGLTNMTIETIANMVWAMDYDIDVKVFDPQMRTDSNFFVADDEVESEAELLEDSFVDDNDLKFEFENASSQ
jgi:transcriptional regulator with XRE-family HTH domain